MRAFSFFRRPHGVGSSLNIWMFNPSSIVRHFRTLITQPGYFYRRLQVMVFQLTHPDAPWLTQKAVDFLASSLHSEMCGFEWGSGRSTIWLAQRVNRLVSVEHDPQWYETICSRAAARNVDYRLAQGVDYAGQIGDFPDEYFDFVLVDGEFREACLRAAATKVRRGGFLILDNADYEFDTSALFEYDRQTTHNGVWRTDIFVRRK